MQILIILIEILVLFAIVMLHVAYATYFERKIIGHMQVRMGPMRVGWHGLLQPIADGIKSFFKEDIIPEQADRVTFLGAPIICLVAMMTSLAVLPFARGWVIADINIGLLLVFAMSSLASYGVVLAGWASNSKFTFLGGLRSMAQVISYEIAMGMSLVGVMMLSGTLNLSKIVEAQGDSFWGMYLFPQIIGFFVFFIAMLAETNRVPFDLPEAETELVSGYCTEYSGMRYAMFFMAEYIGMMVMASIGTICFLGGWNGPFTVSIFPPFWFVAKVYIFMFLFIWIRATMPRYRYDQLMELGWKVLIPLALANIVLTGIVKAFTG
ncbi:NADH-quinone oxidoreductase subunit H [Desulfolithobacter dissulfuricans]|uniref:NADH-quinone oxidoreductase subunit H n=1 Tax=Desulfolithobacter dissulfuricans TaxID=2795293 RepID=A0A915U3H9_9BACT|nr:NADH-quinone oxidoreductase subunit NuoH [Desulfolithobacter dissulfuricans]BCO10679.1 NADH-quinone oxidoreductase subunit H [Desulfolithobacter dissulfuricans]